MAARYLIVNGDDFGQSAGTTAGIVTAFERGILTSASLMVRWPAATAAAAYATAHPNLAVGLHLDLGEWVCQQEEWSPLYVVVPIDDENEVEREVSRQVRVFTRLLGRAPTHLDSHQHVHRLEPVRSVLAAVAARLEIPLRQVTPGLAYCGDFYGQTAKGVSSPDNVGVDALIRIIAALPAGVTELACHPATESDVCSMYRCERLDEFRTLCDPRVRAALHEQQVLVCSFSDRPLTDMECV